MIRISSSQFLISHLFIAKITAYLVSVPSQQCRLLGQQHSNLHRLQSFPGVMRDLKLKSCVHPKALSAAAHLQKSENICEAYYDFSIFIEDTDCFQVS